MRAAHRDNPSSTDWNSHQFFVLLPWACILRAITWPWEFRIAKPVPAWSGLPIAAPSKLITNQYLEGNGHVTGVIFYFFTHDTKSLSKFSIFRSPGHRRTKKYNSKNEVRSDLHHTAPGINLGVVMPDFLSFHILHTVMAKAEFPMNLGRPKNLQWEAQARKMCTIESPWQFLIPNHSWTDFKIPGTRPKQNQCNTDRLPSHIASTSTPAEYFSLARMHLQELGFLAQATEKKSSFEGTFQIPYLLTPWSLCLTAFQADWNANLPSWEGNHSLSSGV